MNMLDIVLCVILGFLGLRGIFRGLVKEVASILGLLLGFILANIYHPLVIPYLAPYLTGGAANLVAYLAIFFGTVTVVFICASLIRKILKLILLGWLDSLAGGVLGFFKGALLCSIIVLALTAFLPARAELLTTSRVVPYVNMFNTFLSTTLPKDMRDQFVERSQELHRQWKAKVVETITEVQGNTSAQ